MNETNTENFHGFLLINKPENYSSFDCIRYLKRILNQKIKIGHTGTLDNFATGLLIICLGRNATKISNDLLNLDKEYIVTAKFGELTDTLDKTGKIIEQKNTNFLSKKDFEKAIKKLGKNYTQTPPIYSALKYKGISLYKLAREKKWDTQTLEKITKYKKRKISIYNIELLNFNNPFFTIKTTVSKGTYIRSLSNDLSQLLSVPATTYQLQRTKIGPIKLKNSINLEKIKNLENIKENIISIGDLRNLLKNNTL
ncbi:tRNA pseudouridine(55) synthase TruB [Candidatus Babeliales bacterium]|nr:tRNA pseudouridine(55) synthase TruB [Candidatus Babeliales bacterium]